LSTPFIIDAHLHLGLPGVLFTPEAELPDLLARMDRLSICQALCTDQESLAGAVAKGLAKMRAAFEQSAGRLHYLAVFDPRQPRECLAALDRAVGWPGLAGVKIHPVWHRVPAEDPRYRPAWRWAAEHDLPLLSHTWSESDYNPLQRLSTPERFEGFVQEFPQVRFVMGHAGGRGEGRRQALRLARQYPQVYLDFAGDIFCNRLIETLTESVPVEKILFGSDFPWLDPRANLSRVLLAPIDLAVKMKILRNNAMAVYRLGTERA
jgi:predicted TIM-barrel fold metal-dependent hydrolase